MTKTIKQRFPRHLHAWRDLGSGQMGGWRYRCALCQRKSRNPLYQSPGYHGYHGSSGVGGMATTTTTTYASYRETQRHAQRRRMR